MGSLSESKQSSAIAARTAIAGVAESAQYLTFILAGEVYALGILNIKEIIQYGDLTEVPMMPNFIRGVINLRGKVVPVVDLTARFGRGVTAVARRTSIVIIEMLQADGDEVQSLGVMVDAVNEVVDIAAADIEPPPAFGARIRPDFISGMARRGGRFIIVLNLAQVLSLEEMSAFGSSLIGGDAHAATELEHGE
ncbi:MULTISPECIES: chemotaxis protein CheW [unclassified Undibacterium]|uniref:chemotaxis protein CheW n=2 Tax=Oxalobacteraceae TaxID=75682 RepID=UPI002AC99B5D|nr:MULTISPECIES: chemotaxis protein CheW [unclassified Undibacterium]MEB0140737.1 chemotaxis protein CheW [Undibacterium sp. CCC2.1]MEB0174096.1 chemotaxis protein CheW [Undibacterium sp. CCC1.1]MEB0178077.1 chemotaxis protein CheW [Undibacterium sp. CCC3.4]MEB0216947.1 chemotaxis protein CheW [Undibacterium sp. 5I2]WPX44534.1 chemotaxis protein CheW [Undibacterium sp. CCC3.4]